MKIAISRTAMATEVSIAEARDQLTRLIRRAEGGEAIEISRRGRPVAALVSISEARRLRAGNPTLWAAIREFRRAAGVRGLRTLSGALDDLRDRSPGREPEL